MLQWALVILDVLHLVSCNRRISVERLDAPYLPAPVPTSIEVPPGSNLTLRCVLLGTDASSDPELIWGRRTKDFQFHTEYDLYELLADSKPPVIDNSDVKYFVHIKNSDRGAYFCASLKYKLFRIVHIKLRNSSCPEDKFRCASNGFCISGHYQCDGVSDCSDGSDESLELCNGDACDGKYRCEDGRCIPRSWCCDRRTDRYCTVTIRHRCCPFLPDPYDPLTWYNSPEHNATKEITKGSGPRYLFIGVCVVSAILSFVLFLFMISKICGFDGRPRGGASTVCEPPPSCGHSECAITRELTGNGARCLYRPEGASDPLMGVGVESDQPPSYAEVVDVEKAALDELVNAPPPPYDSTKVASDIRSCDTNL